MYKENYLVETFEGDKEIINIETVGKFRGGYKHYYNCFICKKQSVGDDKPFYCNNRIELVDKTDTKMYCKNYVKDFEYCKKYGTKPRKKEQQ